MDEGISVAVEQYLHWRGQCKSIGQMVAIVRRDMQIQEPSEMTGDEFVPWLANVWDGLR